MMGRDTPRTPHTPPVPTNRSNSLSSTLCTLRADMPSAASPSPAGGWQNKLVREHTLALVQRGMVPAANPDPWRPLRLDVARAHAGACVAGARPSSLTWRARAGANG